MRFFLATWLRREVVSAIQFQEALLLLLRLLLFELLLVVFDLRKNLGEVSGNAELLLLLVNSKTMLGFE